MRKLALLIMLSASNSLAFDIRVGVTYPDKEIKTFQVTADGVELPLGRKDLRCAVQAKDGEQVNDLKFKEIDLACAYQKNSESFATKVACVQGVPFLKSSTVLRDPKGKTHFIVITCNPPRN